MVLYKQVPYWFHNLLKRLELLLLELYFKPTGTRSWAYWFIHQNSLSIRVSLIATLTTEAITLNKNSSIRYSQLPSQDHITLKEKLLTAISIIPSPPPPPEGGKKSNTLPYKYISMFAQNKAILRLEQKYYGQEYLCSNTRFTMGKTLTSLSLSLLMYKMGTTKYWNLMWPF